MFAVVQTGGKQYRVTTGDVIRVEKLDGTAGDVIVLDKVLFASGDGKTEMSADELGKARVAAEVIATTKADKVIVFKKKRRHNYRRKNGHRQWQTILRISDIALDGNVKTAATAKPAKKAAAPATEAAEKPAAEKKAAAPKKTEASETKAKAAAKKAAPKAESAAKAAKPKAKKEEK
jgi:large subunit ribosomal protein L21